MKTNVTAESQSISGLSSRRSWRIAIFLALFALVCGVLLVGVSVWFLGAVALAGGTAAAGFQDWVGHGLGLLFWYVSPARAGALQKRRAGAPSCDIPSGNRRVGQGTARHRHSGQPPGGSGDQSLESGGRELVELRGIEPLTFALRTRRSPN